GFGSAGPRWRCCRSSSLRPEYEQLRRGRVKRAAAVDEVAIELPPLAPWRGSLTAEAGALSALAATAGRGTPPARSTRSVPRLAPRSPAASPSPCLSPAFSVARRRFAAGRTPRTRPVRGVD